MSSRSAWYRSPLKSCSAVLSVLAVFLAPATGYGGGEKAVIDVSGFSSPLPPESLPDHWELQTFESVDRPTNYQMVTDPVYGPVIRADAAGSAAGLRRRLSIDPEEYQELSWSWKITAVLDGSSLGNRDSDDFPARLLVSFGTDILSGGVPESTLCYVWATSEPVGKSMVSPYNDSVITIVVNSGSSAVGSWQTIRRNIVADHVKVYGKRPGTLRAVSLMTDTDNTDDRAVAWYGPITLAKQPGSSL